MATKERSRRIRSIEERIAFTGIFALILLSVLWFGGVPTLAWTTLAIITFILLAVVTALRLRRTGRLLWHPILVPVLLFAGILFIQWLYPLTINRSITMDGFLQMASYGAFFYIALIAFQRRSHILKTFRGLWWFVPILASEAILQTFTANGYIYWFHDASYATPAGPFVYHNHFAGWMELLFPPLLLLSIRQRRHGNTDLSVRLRWALVPSLIVISVIASLSRGGLIALAIEFVLVLWVERKAITQKRDTFRGLTGVLLTSIVLLPLMNWAPVQHRMANLRHHDASFLERFSVTRTTLDIWNDHRWLGTGFNTFQIAYPAYQTMDTGQTWLAAHDEWAQLLSETGLIGFLAVFAFFTIFFLNSSRVKCEPRSELESILTGSRIAIAVFLLHCGGDFLFHSPADAYLCLALIALSITPAIVPATTDATLIPAPTHQ